MRIWDLPPEKLCSKHLMGEHAELHAIWSILTNNRTGYSRHPETLRWKGKLKALYLRHDELVREMEARGYNHRSPLSEELAVGVARQDVLLDEPAEQLRKLSDRGCGCG